MKHPGTPILYNTNIPVSEGGLCFRARFGIEHEGTNLLAEGSYPKGSDIQDGYPEFSAAMLQQLGWWDDLTVKEKAAADNKNWKTDLSGGIQRVAIKHGCAPFGNAKARCNVWTFPDHIPIHREPLYTVRRDLLPKYETHDDFEYVFRLPTLYKSIQQQDHSAEYPLIITSFRLVEYEGGGEETRSMSWLAELQQEMFVEVNPADCNDYGVKHDDMVWLESPEGNKIQAKVMSTPRIVRGVIGIPYHFAGHYEGKDISDRYPEGTKPYVAGGAADQLWTYGYDPVTNIQETKVSICKMTKVTA
jgi:formate dehydrogenase major subunit